MSSQKKKLFDFLHDAITAAVAGNPLYNAQLRFSHFEYTDEEDFGIERPLARDGIRACPTKGAALTAAHSSVEGLSPSALGQRRLGRPQQNARPEAKGHAKTRRAETASRKDFVKEIRQRARNAGGR